MLSHSQSDSRREVSQLETLISIAVAVTANIISYCICKWLDGDEHDN